MNRNKTPQIITLKNGGTKTIFHTKKFNLAPYGDFKAFWKAMNEAPKENSKRQQRLRDEAKKVN